MCSEFDSHQYSKSRHTWETLNLLSQKRAACSACHSRASASRVQKVLSHNLPHASYLPNSVSHLQPLLTTREAGGLPYLLETSTRNVHVQPLFILCCRLCRQSVKRLLSTAIHSTIFYNQDKDLARSTGTNWSIQIKGEKGGRVLFLSTRDLVDNWILWYKKFPTLGLTNVSYSVYVQGIFACTSKKAIQLNVDNRTKSVSSSFGTLYVCQDFRFEENANLNKLKEI